MFGAVSAGSAGLLMPIRRLAEPCPGPAVVAGPGRCGGLRAVRHNGDVPTVVVRSLPARAGTVIVAVSAVIVVGAVTLSDGPAYGLRAAAWSALVTGVVWLLWWVPELVLDADGLTVRNAWRSHVIRWGAVASLRTRWGLEVVIGAGRIVRASAAPRPGGVRTSLRERRRIRDGRAGPGSRASHADAGLHPVREEYVTPGNGHYRASLDCGSAADLIEGYARAVLERREPLETGTLEVSSRLNTGAVVVAGGLLAAVGAVSLL